MNQDQSSPSGFFRAFILFLLAIGLMFSVLLIYSHQYEAPLRSPRKDLVASAENISGLTSKALVEPKNWSSDSWTEPPATYQRSSGRAGSERTSTGNHSEKSATQGLLMDAITLIDEGNPAAAVEILENILKSDPENETALTELGMIHLIDYKNPKGALTYFRSVLDVNPNNRVIISELVEIYSDLGQSQEATKYLESLQEKFPSNTSLSMGIGQILTGQHKFKEAVPYLEKALESNPSPMDLSDLAEAYSRSGQGDKALATYEKTLQLEQDRLASGFYGAHEKAGQQNVIMAQADYISELLHQNKTEQAQALIRAIEAEHGDRVKDIALQLGRDPRR